MQECPQKEGQDMFSLKEDERGSKSGHSGVNQCEKGGSDEEIGQLETHTKCKYQSRQEDRSQLAT